MRLLCLHGTSLNGKVFEAQTARLQALLPQHYSYEWLNGVCHVEPPKSIRDAHPGPYLSYIDSFSTQDVKSALLRIERVIKKKGPFDGILGFSEGAMLAAALLFRNQIEPQASCASLRLGVFISGMLPLTWEDFIGDPIDLVTRRHPLVDKAVWQRPDRDARISHSRLAKLLLPEETADQRSDGDYPPDSESAASIPRCLHPEMHPERLQLATVHVWGSQDALLGPQSELLLQLMDPDLAESYQYNGGHDLPRALPDIEAVAERVQNATLRSECAI